MPPTEAVNALEVYSIPPLRSMNVVGHQAQARVSDAVASIEQYLR